MFNEQLKGYNKLKAEVNRIIIQQTGHWDVTEVSRLPDHRRKYAEFLQVVIQQLDEKGADYLSLIKGSTLETKESTIDRFREQALKGFIIAVIKLINSSGGFLSNGSFLQANLTELIKDDSPQPNDKKLDVINSKIQNVSDHIGAAGSFFYYITHNYVIDKKAPLAYPDPFQSAQVTKYKYSTIYKTLKAIKKNHDDQYVDNQEAQRDMSHSSGSSRLFGWWGKKSKTNDIHLEKVTSPIEAGTVNTKIAIEELDFSQDETTSSPRY